MSADNQRNGAGDMAFQSRLADLLDDVTVGGETGGAAPGPSGSAEAAPSAPAGPSPAPVTSATVQPAIVQPSTPPPTPPQTAPAPPPASAPTAMGAPVVPPVVKSEPAPYVSAPPPVAKPGSAAPGHDDALPPFLAARAAAATPSQTSFGPAPTPANVAPPAPVLPPTPTVTQPTVPPDSNQQPGAMPGVSLFAARALNVAPAPPTAPAPSVPPAVLTPPVTSQATPVAPVFMAAAHEAPATGPAVTPAQPAVPEVGATPAVLDPALGATGTQGATDAARATAGGQAISIKGRADGLAVEIGVGAWPELMASLRERLQQSAGFFRNAHVALDVGARAITEPELDQVVGLLSANSMILGAVRTSAERTFQAALALGLTATLESADGVPVADAAPAATNIESGAYFVYRGYLRSGHRLQRKESVIVIGDVNPGAEVISDGDVLVWGRLRGVVHAGAHGNTRTIVAALDLEPTQLRIAGVIAIGPDPKPGQPGKWIWHRNANKRPQVARVANQALIVEEWDASRPGGLVSLRRGG